MASAAPLNITLSIGNVSFHLTPSSNNNDFRPPLLSSPQTKTTTTRTNNSSYAVHRQRRQMTRRSVGSSRGTSAFYSQQQLQEHSPNSPPIVSIRHGPSSSSSSSTQQQQHQTTSSSLPNNYVSPTTALSSRSPRNQNRSPLQQHILGRVRSMKDLYESSKEGIKTTAVAATAATVPQAQAQSPSSSLFSPIGSNSSSSGDYCVDLHSFTGTLHISSLLKNNNNNTEPTHDHDTTSWEQKQDNTLFHSPTSTSTSKSLLSPRKKRPSSLNYNDNDISLSLTNKRSKSVLVPSSLTSGEDDNDNNGENTSRSVNQTLTAKNDTKKAKVRFSMILGKEGEGRSSLPSTNLSNNSNNAKPRTYSPSVASAGNKENDHPAAGPVNAIQNNTTRPKTTTAVVRSPQQQMTMPPSQKSKGTQKMFSPQTITTTKRSSLLSPPPPRDAIAAIRNQSKVIARETSSVLAQSSKHFLKQITLAGKDAYVAFNGEAVISLNNTNGTSANSPNRQDVGGRFSVGDPNSSNNNNNSNNHSGNNNNDGAQCDYDAFDGTELHYACASDNLDHIRSLLEYDSLIDLHTADCGGKLPIHLFTENDKLIVADPSGCEEVVFQMIRFMGADKAVQALNHRGLAPFVSIIGGWTEELHRGAIGSTSAAGTGNTTSGGGVAAVVSRSSTANNNPSLGLSTTMDEENQRSVTTPAITPPASSSGNAQSRRRRVAYRSLFHFHASTADTSLISSTDRAKLLYIPESVTIPVHVQWAIRILSRLIDEEYPQRVREAILTNIACVPLFLKSLLLVNEGDTMVELLNMSLVKHTVVDKRSINVWLCAMLTGPREVKMRAVTFMKLLSQMTLDNLAATSKSPDRYSDEEIERFVTLHQDTFNAVYVMPGIVPAVLGLGGQMIENLSTTRVMRYISDRTIQRKSVFFVLICDFFYSIFLLLGYRLHVEFLIGQSMMDGPGHDRVNNYISLSTTCIAFYFLVKDAMTLLSLYLTSKKLAKRYCLSVFNIIDVAAVVMLLGIDRVLSYYSYDPSTLYNEGYAASITIILLWLKLMGAFKILNAAFALFLYAVNEVIREVKWFLLFLVAVVLMFSDAARTVVAARGDCQPDLENVTGEFCSDSLFTHNIRMYAVLAGDVALEYFQTSDAMIAVFVFFSFFSIIILLNILIAIIIDSYEGSKQRSREIFYRARIEYAAHLVARKQFLTPKEYSDFHVATYVPPRVRSALRLIYRCVSVVAALAFEYNFLGALRFLTDEIKHETTRSLMIIYVSVGSIFNLYVFSVAAIALFSMYEKRFNGLNSMTENQPTTLHGIIKKVIWFLDMAVTLLYRILGFNADRSDVSEEFLLAGEDK